MTPRLGDVVGCILIHHDMDERCIKMHPTWLYDGYDMEFIRKRPFLAGAGVGFAFHVMAWLGGGHSTQVSPYTWMAVSMTVAVLALAFMCWPLTSYGDCVTAAGGYGVASAVCGAVRFAVPGNDYAHIPLGPLLIGLPLMGVAIWIVLSGALCVATYLRRRYWPVYSEGCCTECGYDLRMLASLRCPECGTRFKQTG